MSPFVSTGRATAQRKRSQREVARRAFLGLSALVFTASAGLTVVGSMSMSAMGAVPMPGDWTLSMMWLRMCGRTWPAVAASFLDMWQVMMVAMMLPALMPMLWRYRETVLDEATPGKRPAPLTALVCVGYFGVWTVFGVAVFVLGAALAALEIQWPALARAVPVTGGVVVLVAGALQFTAWKARHLACCRTVAPVQRSTSPASAGMAWRHGLHAGLRCLYCCAGLTAILLVLGVMDLRAMALVTTAITAERLAPDGKRVAQAIGTLAICGGLFLIVRATGLV